MRNEKLKKLVWAGLLLCLALVLPFFTGQIPEIGKKLCPMHFPVFLCGMLCGPAYGLACGFLAPLMRALLFGAPALFPDAVAMAAELLCYGLVSGLLYKKLPKTLPYLYVSLLGAMAAGRLAWGGMRYIISGFSGTLFTFDKFLAYAFVNALPGIVIQLVLIPLLVRAAGRRGD